MIGKITVGKSFRGCLLYCLNDKRQEQSHEQVMKNRAELLLFNKCGGSQRELIQQFNEVKQLNPKLAKPVLHITLSLAPGEQLPKDKLMEMCEQCAREMGFESNQYVAIHHLDTNHQHIHIVANRIGFDKHTVSDSNNYQKIAKYCRKMELKYELKQVLSPKLYLSQKERLIPRQDMRKERLREHIKQSLAQSKNYADFERLMKEKRYTILKARGISFIDDKKVKVKGSEVGYSLQTIERILEKQTVLSVTQPTEKERSSQLNITYDQQLKREPAKEYDFSPVDNFTKESSKTIEQMIKPEQTNNHINHELLKKKRKRKRHYHHL